MIRAVTCPRCRLTFAAQIDADAHLRVVGTGLVCLDVRRDPGWHVDNHGNWTYRPHSPGRGWSGYSPFDEHRVTYHA